MNRPGKGAVSSKFCTHPAGHATQSYDLVGSVPVKLCL